MKPRAKKATYELKTTLQSFKKMKLMGGPDKDFDVDMYGNVTFAEGHGPPSTPIVMSQIQATPDEKNNV